MSDVPKPNIPTLSSKVSTEVRRAFEEIKKWASAVYVAGGTGSTTTINNITIDEEDVPEMSAITGFTVTGAFNSIILNWDEITSEYYAYTQVWRSTTDNIGNAELIGMAPGHSYTDIPPDTSLSVTYYYWVCAVNRAGVAGPFNAVAGTAGSTADEPAYILELLTGEITESELYSSLNTRLNNIEAGSPSGFVLSTSWGWSTAGSDDGWVFRDSADMDLSHTVAGGVVSFTTDSDDWCYMAVSSLSIPIANVNTCRIFLKRTSGTGKINSCTITTSTEGSFSQGYAPAMPSDVGTGCIIDFDLDTFLGWPTGTNITGVSFNFSGSTGWEIDTVQLGRKISGGVQAQVKQESMTRQITQAEDYQVKAYSVGDTVFYQGLPYRCTTAIATGEEWNAAHWTAITTPLYAQYAVRLDVNGYISGFGMANDGEESEFGVVADKFWIMHPDPPAYSASTAYALGARVLYGGKQYKCTTAIAAPGEPWNASHWSDAPALFVVTENGVAMDTAFIGDATIKNAMVETVSTDKLFVGVEAHLNGSAFIADGTLTTAKIEQYIRSSNFVTGVSGWQIDQDGDSEFNNSVFRGIVHVVPGASGFNNFSDAPTSLSDINNGEYNALNGMSDLSWVTSGVTVEGRTLTATGSGSMYATTRELVAGGCYLSFSPMTTDKAFSIGFSRSGVVSQYWLFAGDGTVQSGSQGVYTAAGSYATTDVFVITYDVACYKFYKNGVEIYSRTVTEADPLDPETLVSYSYNCRFTPVTGASVGKVRFGPYGSPAIGQWTKPGETTINGNKIYTGDAYVDTLQIKGNAVLVPTIVALADTATCIGGSGWNWTDTGLSASITISASIPGTTVVIICNCSGYWKNNNQIDFIGHYVRVVRNDGVVPSGGGTVKLGNSTDVKSQTFVCMDVPGSGTWTYYLQQCVRESQSPFACVGYIDVGTMALLGAKRSPTESEY